MGANQGTVRRHGTVTAARSLDFIQQVTERHQGNHSQEMLPGLHFSLITRAAVWWPDWEGLTLGQLGG